MKIKIFNLSFFSFVEGLTPVKMKESFDLSYEMESVYYFLKHMFKFVALPNDNINFFSKSVLLYVTIICVAASFVAMICKCCAILEFFGALYSKIFDLSKFLFLFTWIAILSFYLYVNRNEPLSFNLNSNLLFSQFLLFIFCIAFTLIIILLLLWLMNLMANHFDNFTFAFSFLFSLIGITYFLGVTVNAIMLFIIFNSFVVLLLQMFGPSIDKWFTELKINEIFIILGDASNRLIPFLILFSFINYFQLKILKSIFISEASIDSLTGIVKFEFLQSCKGFIFLFLLGWTLFILKSVVKVYFSSLFRKDSVDLKSQMKAIFNSANMIVFNSLFQAFLYSCQIMFSLILSNNLLATSSTGACGKIVIFVFLNGITNYIFAYFQSYNSALLTSSGLNLSTSTSFEPTTNTSYARYDLNFLDDGPLTLPRSREAIFTFLPFLAYLLVLKLEFLLPVQYQVYICMLFVCADIFLDYLLILSSSFTIAESFKISLVTK